MGTQRMSHTAGRSLVNGTMTTVSTRMAHLKRLMTWGGCPCMPSAPPSSADSRNTPKAMAGKSMVVSGSVRSANQDVPPAISDGICNQSQEFEKAGFMEFLVRCFINMLSQWTIMRCCINMPPTTRQHLDKCRDMLLLTVSQPASQPVKC